jgi:hypothetical protein
VRATVRDRVHMMPIDDLRILPSRLREKAGAAGGIALAAGLGL